MDDILANWKNCRFARVDFELLDQPDIMVVLTDVGFWNAHFEELKDWCDENESEIQGLTVKFNSEQSLLLFTLRWA